MNKKLHVLILCIIMLLFGTRYGYAEEIQPIDLDTPKYLSLEVVDDQFVLGWKNPFNEYTMRGIEYQIDFKLGRGQWISTNMELLAKYLSFTSDGKSTVKIDPIKEGLIKDKINLDENSYSFRVRYRYRVIQNGAEVSIDGYFSSPARLGFLPYYENASSWAFEELDRAVEYNMIPDDIRDDMKKEITREEFSEVVVRLYELQTGNPVNHNDQSFNDTTNPEILKAASLGIVNGVGDGSFLPNNPITKQEIAVMLKRAWSVIRPKMNFAYDNNSFTSQTDISSWALDDVNFMKYKGILKGDNSGLINPIENISREQAVILTLRTYDLIK